MRSVYIVFIAAISVILFIAYQILQKSSLGGDPVSLVILMGALILVIVLSYFYLVSNKEALSKISNKSESVSLTEIIKTLVFGKK